MTRAFCILSLPLFFSLVLVAGCGGSSSNGDPDPLDPGVGAQDESGTTEAWANNMKQFGRQHCAEVKNGGLEFDQRLGATYYDAEWVYYQIGDFTGDRAWSACAQAAEEVYRDRYVFPANGNVPGYWNFTHGLTVDAIRTGDAKSKQAVLLLSKHAAFAKDDTPLGWTSSSETSREVAYAIMSYLNAEALGEPRRARLGPLVSQALGHIDQWTSGKAPYVRPFMVGLTGQALIMYHQRTNDSRVLPALAKAAEWLWKNTWVPSAQAFKYTDRKVESGGTEPSPDLNLLVVPIYGYLYSQTREVNYRDWSDQIFAGGVRSAYLQSAKQFNQSYRWSFDFVRWRRG